MSFTYQRDRLLNREFFSDEERGKLAACVAGHSLADLLASPRWKEESAIDFVFTSAQIEGNTYTRAETISLLKMGRTAGGKRYNDAVMIVNLRTAYDYLLENASRVLATPKQELAHYHAMLMTGLLAEKELGAPSTTKGRGIGATGYQPIHGAERLNRELDTLIAGISEIANPFDKSLYAAANLSYLQYFEDGNKRTSRVFQNAVLLAHGFPPVLFPVEKIEAYIEATLHYYEHGDYSLLRSFTVEAYEIAYPPEGDAKPKAAILKP